MNEEVEVKPCCYALHHHERLLLFQKERDLELYLVGAALTYAAGKHICRTSEHDEKCGVGAAAAFVIWY